MPSWELVSLNRSIMGGIEDNAASIAEAMAPDHEVTVIVNAHDGAGETIEMMNGVRVIRRKVLVTVANQPIALGLLRGIDVSAFDVIHFHAPNPFASALLILALIGKRRRPELVITHHMDIFGRPALREASLALYRVLVKSARAVIVTSMKNAAISRDIPAGSRLVAVPLGVRPDRYILSDDERQAALEWRRSLAGDKPLVGFLGRHARYKGLDVLIKALAEMPGVHAAIAGDGPLRRETEALAVKLGISDRVHFLGSVDHRTKVKMLSVIDAYLFPSTEITEAFGISQLEAMICGAPVVASNLPTGVTDVSIDDYTALLCKPSDAADLARQAQRILGDPTLADRLRHQAKAHVLATMTEERIQVRTREILHPPLAHHAVVNG